MKPIVKASGLSKKYRIQTQAASYNTLRDALVRVARSPLRNIRSRLKKSNETIWALADVNFEVTPGEVMGIIGRNGAGKSTLLKILSRITEPTTGRVELYGRVGSLLEVGTGFHPELTGRENLFLNGSILGMKRREIARKLDEIVAFAEIEKFLDTPVKFYSSGMYMRLAFAVAAHLEPEILIVDEVLAVGDMAFQKKCLGKIGTVAKGGRTVLFVSHNMVALQNLCSRVVWLDHGAVVQQGDTAEVIANYARASSSAATERSWEDPDSAPGNDHVRIRRAVVRPAEDTPDNSITVRTPVELEFEFWNFLPGARLNFTVHVSTMAGAQVFAAGSDPRNRPSGLLREVVRIPPNFLNDERYGVSIQVVQDTASTLYFHADILTFEVKDVSRGDTAWFGKWPGVVRPKLEWLSQDL